MEDDPGHLISPKSHTNQCVMHFLAVKLIPILLLCLLTSTAWLKYPGKT